MRPSSEFCLLVSSSTGVGRLLCGDAPSPSSAMINPSGDVVVSVVVPEEYYYMRSRKEKYNDSKFQETISTGVRKLKS